MTDTLSHWVCGNCGQDTSVTHFYQDRHGVSQHAEPYVQQMLMQHETGQHNGMTAVACPRCAEGLVKPLPIENNALDRFARAFGNPGCSCGHCYAAEQGHI